MCNIYSSPVQKLKNNLCYNTLQYFTVSNIMQTFRNRKGGRRNTRKGPNISATETELGRTMLIGYGLFSNGQRWIVEKAGKSQRWNKATGYFTHDNGGRPFYIKIRDGHITVLKGKCDEKCVETNVGPIYNKHVITIPKYEKVWIGANKGKYANKREDEAIGNSILVHIKQNKYIFIGDHVSELTIPDKIKEFYGILGYSDVVYPFAIGEKNTYFFLEDKYLPNTQFELKEGEDPYKIYFENEKLAKKIPGKVIQKREI